MELPLRVHLRTGFGGDTEKSMTGSLPSKSSQPIAVQVALICVLSFNGLGLRANAYCSFCLKVFFNPHSQYQVCGDVSPSRLFFLCPSIDSLELPAFPSSQSPTLDQSNRWLPFTLQDYRGGSEAVKYLCLSDCFFFFFPGWHSVSAPQNSRASLQGWGKIKGG